MVDLAVAPKDAAIVAPQAKKLYVPEKRSDDVVAKPRVSEQDGSPARRAFPVEVAPAPVPWAAENDKGNDHKPNKALSSGLAWGTEEDDDNRLQQANDSLAQRRVALSTKAKRAYAQFAV